jgi:hypothetical protein
VSEFVWLCFRGSQCAPDDDIVAEAGVEFHSRARKSDRPGRGNLPPEEQTPFEMVDVYEFYRLAGRDGFSVLAGRQSAVKKSRSGRAPERLKLAGAMPSPASLEMFLKPNS